jgi:hypothetical protein
MDWLVWSCIVIGFAISLLLVLYWINQSPLMKYYKKLDKWRKNHGSKRYPK